MISIKQDCVFPSSNLYNSLKNYSDGDIEGFNWVYTHLHLQCACTSSQYWTSSKFLWGKLDYETSMVRLVLIFPLSIS